MPEIPHPVYLVDAYSDPVLIRIQGRACFQNSACLKDFVAEMLRQGKQRMVIDFQQCASMDSTFLGVLAGTALEMRRLQPPGSLVLARMSPRNLELVRNLGLHRLLTVDADESKLGFGRADKPLACTSSRSELENARLVLDAHENLVAADASNQAKFQDVLAFLRNRVQQQ